MFGGGGVYPSCGGNNPFKLPPNLHTSHLRSLRTDERPDHVLHRDDPEPGHTTGLTVPGGGDAVSNLWWINIWQTKPAEREREVVN